MLPQHVKETNNLIVLLSWTTGRFVHTFTLSEKENIQLSFLYACISFLKMQRGVHYIQRVILLHWSTAVMSIPAAVCRSLMGWKGLGTRGIWFWVPLVSAECSFRNVRARNWHGIDAVSSSKQLLAAKKGQCNDESWNKQTLFEKSSTILLLV